MSPKKNTAHSASDRVQLLQDEPFSVHTWTCTPLEFQRFLWNPRAFLEDIGLTLPAGWRIETLVENHDFIGEHADGLQPDPGIVISNIGRAEPDGTTYRIVTRGHEAPGDMRSRRRLRAATARR